MLDYFHEWNSLIFWIPNPDLAQIFLSIGTAMDNEMMKSMLRKYYDILQESKPIVV